MWLCLQVKKRSLGFCFAMAEGDVDFSELFSGANSDDDDGRFCIDIQTILNVLDEDDDCNPLEVGFLLQRVKFPMLSL